MLMIIKAVAVNPINRVTCVNRIQYGILTKFDKDPDFGDIPFIKMMWGMTRYRSYSLFEYQQKSINYRI